MKKAFLLFAALCLTALGMAQNTQRVLRVHDNGQVVFQMPTNNLDSIKSHNRIATIFFGDGSWSRNIHSIDSITFAQIAAGDTTVIIDTTAVDTSSTIRLHWMGDSVAITNPYASNGVAITTNGAKVSITAAANIANLVYELSGATTTGSFELATDKKFILMLNGVSITSNSNKAPINIKENKDGVLHLVEGTLNTFVDDASNSAKSCVYSKGSLTVQGAGAMNITSVAVNGLQGKKGVKILNGNTTITVSADASKGIKTDESVEMDGGTMQIVASGNLIVDTLDDGTFDKSYCSGIKPDKDFVMNGGNLTIDLPSSNRGGRCISTTGNTIINGGNLTMTTAGAGACLGGTGTNATDGYVNACIKSDSNIYLYGGHISAVSTGTGGRGITADGNLYFGLNSVDNERLFCYVKTSGATTNAVGGSGGPGGPGGWGGNTSDNDYFKGIAKAIRIEGNIYIYSGHLQAYCAQTSGDPTGEAIETKDSMFVYGGDIEANSYDDAINATTYLEIRGGRIWAYSRGNDGIDCNGNTNIYGGLLLVKGNEVGIDAATDAGGRFSIYGGTMITQGGTMGAWDTPNGSSTQRWITIQNANYGNNGILVKNAAGDTLLIYKNNTVSGSGFINADSKAFSKGDLGNGTKPPGGGGSSNRNGLVFSSPDIHQGQSYTVWTSCTPDGGQNWHGFFSDGATATTTSSSTTVNAQ